jgi:predicted DNA-binding WGR domain protein
MLSRSRWSAVKEEMWREAGELALRYGVVGVRPQAGLSMFDRVQDRMLPSAQLTFAQTRERVDDE